MSDTTSQTPRSRRKPVEPTDLVVPPEQGAEHPAVAALTEQVPIVGNPPPDPQRLVEIASSLTQIAQDLVFPVAQSGITLATVGSAYTRVDSAARIYRQVGEMLRQVQVATAPLVQNPEG